MNWRRWIIISAALAAYGCSGGSGSSSSGSSGSSTGSSTSTGSTSGGSTTGTGGSTGGSSGSTTGSVGSGTLNGAVQFDVASAIETTGDYPDGGLDLSAVEIFMFDVPFTCSSFQAAVSAGTSPTKPDGGDAQSVTLLLTGSSANVQLGPGTYPIAGAYYADGGLVAPDGGVAQLNTFGYTATSGTVTLTSDGIGGAAGSFNTICTSSTNGGGSLCTPDGGTSSVTGTFNAGYCKITFPPG